MQNQKDHTATNPRANQRQQLQAWIDERERDLALRQIPSLLSPSTHDPLDQQPADINPWKPAPAQPKPRIGDIRLLPPAPLALPETDRPLYILVLANCPPDSWHIVPFSRLALPATPAEWITGLSDPPLRVLCLWNKALISTNALTRTWRLRAMPKPKCATALRIARMASHAYPAGGIPPRRIGPPLLHPLDPRLPYLAEEQLLLSELTQALLSPTAPHSPLYAFPKTDTTLLRAAEPPHDSG